MALASLADVKRTLQLPETTTEEDSQLTKALQVAEDWMTRVYLRYNYSSTVKKFWDVREDEDLFLPEGATVVSVQVQTSPNGTLRTLGAAEYDVEDNRVRLRPSIYEYPYPTTGTDTFVAKRVLGTNNRVDITYSGVTVPSPVRDATAGLAAWVWQSQPITTKGITSESIGDYSYSLSDTGEIPTWIKMMARPYRARRSLVP